MHVPDRTNFVFLREAKVYLQVDVFQPQINRATRNNSYAGVPSMSG
jgi:hypothetical protein